MTGKKCVIELLGRRIVFYNQNSTEWAKPYECAGDGGTLHRNGCGIFSLCHCAQWLTDREASPEYWAEAALRMGAVDGYGTVRPVLLRGLTQSGEAARLGFRYEDEGLLNDTDALFAFLKNQRGVAMGNVRPGHIVALVAARERDNGKQILVIDSMAESCAPAVRQKIADVVPGTEISASVLNGSGIKPDEVTAYGAYWVSAASVKKYSLLHKV